MEVLIRTSNHLSTGAQGAHHPGHAAMAIDFTLTSAQQRLQRNAREFAVEILQPLVKTADREPDTQKAFQTLEGAYIECHKLGFGRGVDACGSASCQASPQRSAAFPTKLMSQVLDL